LILRQYIFVNNYGTDPDNTGSGLNLITYYFLMPEKLNRYFVDGVLNVFHRTGLKSSDLMIQLSGPFSSISHCSTIKYYFALILLSSSTVTLAQDTKMIKEYLNANTRAEFEVLKSDRITKNGVYKEFYSSNFQTRMSGFYKSGLKDSTWTEYDRQGMIMVRGNYKNNERVGIWTYFDRTGHIFSKYDFKVRGFIFSTETKADSAKSKMKKYRVVEGKDTLLTLVDKPAEFLGGGMRFDLIVSNNIRMPYEAKRAFVNGRSVISFTIDTTGHPVNIKIKEMLGYGCDEEVIRAILLTKDDWLPAVFQGKTVPFIIDLPFAFRTF
jgi:hypothetical protein